MHMRKLWMLLLVGCGSATELKTMADACFQWADVLCTRAQSCGALSTTVEKCRGDLTGICCTGHDCTAEVGACANGAKTCCGAAEGCKPMMVDLGAVEACTDAFRAESCGQVASGLKPNACL